MKMRETPEQAGDSARLGPESFPEEPFTQDFIACCQIAGYPVVRVSKDLGLLRGFVDNAVGTRAGRMNEPDVITAGNDKKRNVAVQPYNIDAGSGEEDLFEKGVIVHSDSDPHFSPG
tara:strand:- start:734 stop:1084 length:351 start_codon:yes stop_codon:yes gene_type:complete